MISGGGPEHRPQVHSRSVIGGDRRMVTLRDACGFGWMAMACPRERSSGQGDQGSAAALRELVVAGWRGGLVSFEELVHDLGAGGDDRSQFAAVDHLGGAGGGVPDQAGDFLDADAVVAEQADK
jgi:hypothetical protein